MFSNSYQCTVDSAEVPVACSFVSFFISVFQFCFQFLKSFLFFHLPALSPELLFLLALFLLSFLTTEWVFCEPVFHYYPASLRWDSIQIPFFSLWLNNIVGLFDIGSVLLCPIWFIFSNGAVLNANNAQFLLLALLMKQISRRAWDNSHMMLLFSHRAGVTQPKESDLGGESLAERERTQLTAQSSFTRTASKDVLELMMWEPAQCELLRLGIF